MDLLARHKDSCSTSVTRAAWERYISHLSDCYSYLIVLSANALVAAVCLGCSGIELSMSGQSVASDSYTPSELFCSSEMSGDLLNSAISVTPTSPDATVDLFFFEAAPGGRLDSWQRFGGRDISSITGQSRTGEKVAVALSDAPWENYSWYDCNCLEVLGNKELSLACETAEKHFARAKASMQAGSSQMLEMENLASRVTLSSLSVDFSSRPYSGASLENIKVYLINVNASCPIFPGEDYKPSAYINLGKFRENDLDSFADKSVLYRELDHSPSPAAETLGLEFFCFANPGADDSPGCRITRLVIEAEMGGTRLYYPINVGTCDPAAPNCFELAPGTSYDYDVKITRKGVTDPDTPLSAGVLEAGLVISPWKRMEVQIEEF